MHWSLQVGTFSRQHLVGNIQWSSFDHGDSDIGHLLSRSHFTKTFIDIVLMIFHRGGDLLASQSCYAALVDRWSIRPTRPPLTYGIFAHTSAQISSIPTIQNQSVVPSRGPRTFPVRIVTHFAPSAPISRWSQSAPYDHRWYGAIALRYHLSRLDICMPYQLHVLYEALPPIAHRRTRLLRFGVLLRSSIGDRPIRPLVGTHIDSRIHSSDHSRVVSYTILDGYTSV